MNKLPGKLSLLRKSTGLPQTEIAARLQIPVNEYMNWENGNSIPSIDQSKKLAEFFHVELAALLDNTMSFVAPAAQESPMDASVEIPFAANGGINATQPLSSTLQLPAQNDDAEEVGGSTRVMDTSTFTSMSNAAQTADTYDDEEEEEQENTGTTKKVNRTSAPKNNKKPLLKNKTNIIIIASCLIAAVILAVVLLLTRGGSRSGSLSKSNVNRLVLTDKYSLYIGDSSIQARGETPSSITNLNNSIQVSAYSDFAGGLKSDGTVVTTDTDLDLSDFKDITNIAVGQSHIAGVKKDGTVVCTGSENACKVSEWQNIKAVYAGNDITIGLKEDGSFVSSGGVSIPTDVKGVTGVSIANNAVYYVNKNGTVSSISLNGGSALATNSLSNVTMVSAGDNILAGLKKDGTVTVVSDSDDVKTTVSSWKNVQYIAAKGNTLIAITKNGKMYGVGDNNYNQYENTAEAEEKEDSKQLSSVKNIQFEVTTESLKISWDKVEHADSYEVIFNGGTPSLVKETSMTVGVSDLKDGESYSVSITAKTSDEKKYKDSDPTTTTYQYNAKTTQLAQPSGLNTTVDSGGSWTISWNSVENASYYIITLNGEQVDRIGGTSYTISKDALINNMNYTVGVRAGSDDSKYSESGETQVSTVYSAPSQKLQVTVHFVDADSGEAISDGASYTTTLDEGTYTGEELAQGHLSGYTVVEGQSFTIGADDNSSFNITVNVRPNSN